MLDLTKKSDSEYNVLSTLGRGSFGTTFLTTKKGDPTGKKYVLKVLTITSNNITDIFQEVDVLRKIAAKGCPSGVLCYHDYFVTELDGRAELIIVTEAFDNSITLGKFIYARELIPLESQDLLKIMHELLEGLYYLHKHKFAHGDIKPDNIMINSNLQTQIIDFGLSCRKKCKPGGSILFSAPEMLRLLGSRKEIQRSFLVETDVFSMGIVFYLLANFKFPYTYKSNQYIPDQNSEQSESYISSDSVSNRDVESVISSKNTQPKEVYDVNFGNDVLGIDRFWKGKGKDVKSYYTGSDTATNADINDLIESMLIVGTHTQNARPSSKRLLSKLRKIIYKYNFRQTNLITRKTVVLPINTELEAFTPLTPSPKAPTVD